MSQDGRAPEGMLWVCFACGKYTTDKYDARDCRGWDESCMINCALVPADRAIYNKDKSRVIEIKDHSK